MRCAFHSLHSLCFLPGLSPDVDPVSADENSAGVGVHLHGSGHALFQVFLLWGVLNNWNNQSVIIPESKHMQTVSKSRILDADVTITTVLFWNKHYGISKAS